MSSSTSPKATVCWSCEKRPKPGPFCSFCGAIQPPDLSQSHFQVLGLVPDFNLDLSEAERAYKKLSRQLHPDRFVRKGANAKTYALRHSVQLNDAWRVLKDNHRRAAYMLDLAGVRVDDARVHRVMPDGTEQPIEMPKSFLFETVEMQEELAEAKETGNQALLDKMKAEADAELSASYEKTAAGLSAGTEAGLASAAIAFMKTRFLRRFLASF